MDNFASPAQLISGRRYRSTLPINTTLLRIHPVNNDEFIELRRGIQDKQGAYYNQHSKPLKDLYDEEKVRILEPSGKKWKPATVMKRYEEPRSFCVKTEDGTMYRRNRRHLLKTNEGNRIQILDDKQDTSELNKSTDGSSTNNNSDVGLVEDQPNLIKKITTTKSGRISRRPKVLDEYETNFK